VAETLLSASAKVHAPSARSHQITVPSSRTQACESRYDTLTNWLDKYLNGGLSELKSDSASKAESSFRRAKQQLKAMVMTQRPIDYGIERQMWTGAILSEVIAQRFEVQLKDSRIYELLDRVILSARPSRLC